MSHWLDTRGGHTIHSLELYVPDDFLDLSGVRFVFEALAGPSDDSVEHEAFVVIRLAGSKSGTYGELRPQLRLQPLELGPSTKYTRKISYFDNPGTILQHMQLKSDGEHTNANLSIADIMVCELHFQRLRTHNEHTNKTSKHTCVYIYIYIHTHYIYIYI